MSPTLPSGGGRSRSHPGLTVHAELRTRRPERLTPRSHPSRPDMDYRSRLGSGQKQTGHSILIKNFKIYNFLFSFLIEYSTLLKYFRFTVTNIST